jgi:hypothetical protein
MKHTFIIIVPLVVILIAALGYASNIFSERYYWEPKYRYTKSHVPDFEYKVDKFVPFLLVFEGNGHKDGKAIHERYVVLQFFGLHVKLITYENSAK